MRFSSRLFISFILRDLLKNWVRSFITIGGIALGVSVFLAITLANETALSKFRETVDVIAGKANLEIRSQSGRYIPLSYMEQLVWLQNLGVRFAPMLQDTVVFGKEGSEPVQLVGIDVLADQDFFAGGVGTNESYDMFAPGAALVGWRLAETFHLKVGDDFDLTVNDRQHKFHVSGILEKSGLGGAFSGNVVATDIENAQAALDSVSKISEIELIVPDNRLDEIKEEIQASLPATMIVERPESRGNNVEKMTRSFQYNLTALAFIALIVGMFLIHNTITISVIRRRAEIGTLRALGLPRRQVSALFMGEAAAFGVLGSAVGVACGVVFADGALSAIAGTMEHFYFQHPFGSTSVEPSSLLRAFLIGLVITMVAAVPPIWESTTVQPAEAVRRSSLESKVLGSSGRLSLIGLLLFLGCWLAAQGPPINGFPFLGYLSALCAILGMSFCTPILVKSIFGLVGSTRAFRRIIGVEGTLAARSLYGASGRTSLAIASLMIGISMMISLAIMISSFRSTVVAWVDQTLKADLWIQSASRERGSRQARLSEAVSGMIQKLPGVVAVDGFVEQRMLYRGEPSIVSGGEFNIIKRFGGLRFTSGESVDQVFSRLTSKSCLISESFAIRRNVCTGDTIEVPTDKGIISLSVGGVYYDYSSDLGQVVIDRELYKKYFDDHSLTSIAVYLRPDVDLEQARSEILNAVNGYSLICIRSTRELRKEAMRVFDRTFAVTYALHTIAVTVALLSIMNALLALSFESRRDFGILRYLGAQRGQLQAIVYGQSFLLGCLGNGTGLFVGGILSLLLVNVINRQSFGWTVQLAIPWDFIAQSSLLVLLAALAAGFVPARQAARTKAPEVVRDE
ncbi:MAG: ABC transporter permease [Candidatus Obscuribacterales bacterium]|nr:ABC transporter permease [Candidatus Obscuribacterales bacterium]